MLLRRFFLVNLSLVAALLASVGDARAADQARLVTYKGPEHTDYALSLSADLPPAAASTDVVVLFDTSASQQGAYRETAVAALRSLMTQLRPTDRVRVIAVDLDAKPLDAGFAAPSTAAADAAVAAIMNRAPLGSTDLEQALSAAIEQFQAAGSEHRAVVYIGDGVSMANMLDGPTLRPLAAKLREERVPVSSYAIGPQIDGALLAVLANQSGGNLYIAEPIVWQDEEAGVSDARAREENERNAAIAGRSLAEWTGASVLWPQQVSLPPALGQTYPAVMPPLRSDRDTIVIGETTDALSGDLPIRIASGNTHLSWSATAEPSHPDHAFLAALVERARQDNGLSLPTVGSAGLAEAARLVGVQVDGLTRLAQQAVAAGDRQTAGRIIQTVLQADPGNVQARTVQAIVESDDPFGGFEEPAAVQPGTVMEDGSVVVGEDGALPPELAAEAGRVIAAEPLPEGAAIGEAAVAEAVAAESGIILVNPPAAAGAASGSMLDDPSLLSDLPSGGAFLDEVEQERRVFEQMMQKEIERVVADARGRMRTEPDLVIQDLKLQLDNLKKVANIDEARRAELIDRLEIALKEARRQATLADELKRERQEVLAAAREQIVLNDRLNRRIEREKQLMDRFDALMSERNYVQAEEVAAIVEEIDPDSVTARSATLWSRTKRHVYLVDVARSARHAAAFDAMYQIELSHIPFPDNPPIVYPDAEVWEELSNRRKKRYASVDLKSQGESESRIYDALRKPLVAPLEYIETPLNQITAALQEDYNIPIVFDKAALDTLAISPEVEITVNLSNITLRSALELMLKEVEDLTYIIDNEVLLITSADEAEQRLQVKVYPVADLVLPIQPLGLTGGIGGSGGGGGGLGGGGG
ncbi:MAG: VWA domain-containing protein, partial [Planctomycetales bacterium]|nr:VWA domain-containing protein [Planctomycetales bacterium]